MFIAVKKEQFLIQVIITWFWKFQYIFGKYLYLPFVRSRIYIWTLFYLFIYSLNLFLSHIKASIWRTQKIWWIHISWNLYSITASGVFINYLYMCMYLNSHILTIMLIHSEKKSGTLYISVLKLHYISQ